MKATISIVLQKGAYIAAANIMTHQHHGQKDKAGRDYYFHPAHVSFLCNDTDAKIVALLHDTIEDTDLYVGELLKSGIDRLSIYHGLAAVTRRPGETYAEFIQRASHEEIGCEVKISDLRHNMDITRLTDLKEKDWHRLNKYLHAWRFLNRLEKDTSLIIE